MTKINKCNLFSALVAYMLVACTPVSSRTSFLADWSRAPAQASSAAPAGAQVLAGEQKPGWVALHPDEIFHGKRSGLLWQPFILPTEDHVTLGSIHFFLGFVSPSGDFIAPPEAGSCRLLESEPRSPTNAVKKMLVFRRSKPDPSDNNLFFLLRPPSETPYAVVRFDTHGVSRCYVDDQDYVATYQFGSAQKQQPVVASDRHIVLDWESAGLLAVDPVSAAAHTPHGLHNGDLVRIGRTQQTADDESVPLPVQQDLFRMADFSSQSMGVWESLHTSFLVGNSPFQIALEPGFYQIAVLRKNTLVCLTTVTVSSGSTTPLACQAQAGADLEKILFDKDHQTILFDDSLYPTRFALDKDFLAWHMSSKRFYFGQNRPTGAGDGLEGGGTGWERLAGGAVPFLRWTAIQLQHDLSSAKALFQEPYAQASNGVDIKIFQPFLNADGKLTSMAEQYFRFRITIPHWNSTHIVEMNINGHLYKRWILRRGDISQPFATTLEAQTFEPDHFVINVVARGDTPLPYFLTGVMDELPYARTRDYEVIIRK